MRPQLRGLFLGIAWALCSASAVAGALPAGGTLDKPRVMLLPEFDVDQLGPREPTATVGGQGGQPAALEGVPAKCFLLIRTLLSRELLRQRYDLVDPRVADRVASIYTRLREFREPGVATGNVDSAAQRVAYQYNADVIVFYKLLIHEAVADPDVPKVKLAHDSVQVRAVAASTGRVFAFDERTAKGISETDEYLAHRMAIERILGSTRGPNAQGLAAYVDQEVQSWWADYRKSGRPVLVNFYVQGEDATRLQQLAALLTSESVPGIVGPPRPRRSLNSEQTHEMFAEYEISYLGPLQTLQAALVANVAKLELAEGLALADKYRVTIDAFGENVTICLLDPERPEVRPGVGVITGTGTAIQGAAGTQQAVAAAARRATVMVRTYTQQGDQMAPAGHGSGFVVAPEGLVVTCYHVVEGARRFFLEFEAGEGATGNPQFEAEVVRSMPDRDLALLRIKLLRPGETQFPTLPLGRSTELRVGDPIAVIGAPFSAELINNVTFGTVSALGRGPKKYIVHTAPTFGGSSGGPVVNLRGQVVGIHTASPTGAVFAQDQGQRRTVGHVAISGFAYAIPVEMVADLLR